MNMSEIKIYIKIIDHLATDTFTDDRPQRKECLEIFFYF